MDFKLDKFLHHISRSQLEYLDIIDCKITRIYGKRVLEIVKTRIGIVNITMTSSSEGDGSHDDANATNAHQLGIDKSYSKAMHLQICVLPSSNCLKKGIYKLNMHPPCHMWYFNHHFSFIHKG